MCEGSQTSSAKISSLRRSWGIADASGSGFVGSIISSADRLYLTKDLLVTLAGKSLGCLVNVSNSVGSAQSFFTTPVPISVAPALPIPGNLSISKQ